MKADLRFRLQHIDYQDRIGLWIAEAKSNYRFAEVSRVEFTEMPEGSAASLAPCLEMGRDSAIRLMDELWALGIRPTEQGTGGQLEAVKYHLEDLRKLVFAKDSIKSSESTQTLYDVWNRIEQSGAAKAGEEK